MPKDDIVREELENVRPGSGSTDSMSKLLLKVRWQPCFLWQKPAAMPSFCRFQSLWPSILHHYLALKRWLLALVYSPWIPRFTKSSWRVHQWIPKIQLFWLFQLHLGTSNWKLSIYFTLGCLWTLDWGFWNIQQHVEMEWSWLDYFTNMNLPLHHLKTALIWPTRSPGVTSHQQEQPTTHDAAPSNIQDSSIFHAKVASKVICKPQNGLGLSWSLLPKPIPKRKP